MAPGEAGPTAGNGKQELEKLRTACFTATRERLRAALTTDQLVIQAANAVQDLHKVSNTLAKRLRDWSGGWQPELERAMDDHERFIKELLKSENVAAGIGTPLAEQDQQAIRGYAAQVLALYEERKRLMTYIETQLRIIMPNTLALCGAPIAAELLAHAGSLESLATMPSGTVQLLGAETALFRHLKNKKHRSPKHGVIFNHPLVLLAPHAERGRRARALADKISIAVKVDRFKGEPCGEELRRKLEQRFGGRS